MKEPCIPHTDSEVQELCSDNGDSTSIELPQVQRNILQALHKAGKKIVLPCVWNLESMS